jgi:nucleotide-binding universal stress UspA family protein
MKPETLESHCPPKAIVVGVDFGDASARALAIAGVVASGFHARLCVLHAERFEPPAYFTVDQIARLESERRTAEKAATAHLTQFAVHEAGHGVEPLVVDAPPVDAIVGASGSADLIVLGTHGRRGPGRWWLGSVAERVVRAAVVPVLVTRAATLAARAVFERLAIVHDGPDDSSVAACAGQFATLASGTVTNAGPLHLCDADALQSASLVVMAIPDRRTWSFTDAVARALGACDRPVLFIPPR